MDIPPPKDWKEVDPIDFQNYLSSCPDYLKDSYSNGTYYRFRHNKEKFAFQPDQGPITVNPDGSVQPIFRELMC
jgi:hypothetical protein